MHVIYLHGFCSSKASFKAQLVKQYVEQQDKHTLYLIDLPFSPIEAMTLIESHIETLGDNDWGLIGSSLGGFYATHLSEKHNKKAVLINPAVYAHELLARLLGENKNYHSGELFDFTEEHLQQLKAMHLLNLKWTGNFLLLTQTGDEVLDFQKGVDYYQGSEQVVIQGGDHAFADYGQYLTKTIEFLTPTSDRTKND